MTLYDKDGAPRIFHLLEHGWEMQVGDRVVIDKGAAHQRMRRGDAGTIVSLYIIGAKVKLDRTQRHVVTQLWNLWSESAWNRNEEEK